MIRTLAILGALVLGGIGMAHLAWAFGRRPSGGAFIPTRPDGTPVLAPGRGITLVVAALLFLAAFLLLQRGGVGVALLPERIQLIGAAGVAVVLLLRGIGDFRYVGLFKCERDTPFGRMDSRYYTPLVLALSLLAGFVALRGG
jgi:hypothetical protein